MKSIAAFTQQVRPWAGDAQAKLWLDTLESTGFIVIPSLLAEDDIRRFRNALAPYLARDQRGRNVFEGVRSHRVYAMLAKDPCFSELIAHPLALAFAEYLLGPSCLLSACLAIDLMPGESAQPWHTDDAHIHVPPPHNVFGISTFWTLDEVTDTNGATEFLPGSHLWAEADFPGVLRDGDFSDVSDPKSLEDPGYHSDACKATAPAGSLVIARSDVWHRGGANVSEENRLIVTPQYCAGWARPLESMLLAVPPKQAKALPPRVQELLGYSIHPPFMGYSDGVHPNRILRQP